MPRLALILSAITVSALACTISTRGPDAGPGSAAPSPDALVSFNDKWLGLSETFTNGQFTLSFTEAEMASIVEQAIANTGTNGDEDIPLESVRIKLEDDIVLYATTGGPFVEAPGIIVLQPSIGTDGSLQVQVVSSEFGQLSLDELLLERIALTIAGAVVSPSEGMPVEIVLNGVQILDQQLVLTGSIIE